MGVDELCAGDELVVVDSDADVSELIDGGVARHCADGVAETMREPTVELILVDRGGPVFFTSRSQTGERGRDLVFEFDPGLLCDSWVVLKLGPPRWGVVEGAEFPEGEDTREDNENHRADQAEHDSVFGHSELSFHACAHGYTIEKQPGQTGLLCGIS